MYLIDTNIFLEILLDQDKSDKCKSFLNDLVCRSNSYELVTMDTDFKKAKGITVRYL